MENFYLSFFLAHIIVTVSPLEVVNSDDLYGVSKRLTLRSSDPLSRRSPELHFLRFGRRSESSPFDYHIRSHLSRHFAPVKPFQQRRIALNKREADYDLENDVETSDEKSTNIVDVDYAVGSQTNDDRIVRVNPIKMAKNVSRHRLDDTPSSDTEADIRYYSIPSTTYDRSTRSVKLDGRPVTFNRFDRGRDNFMRLGRSSDRERRRSDNFLRLGRDKQYERNSRKMDNSIRFGRRNGDNANHERDTRKYDNFMRLGRTHADNFMRLGRTGSGVKDATVSRADHEYDRLVRKVDNFLRLGRQSEDDTIDWIEEKKRTSADDDVDDDTSVRRSQKSAGFMRLGRRSDGKLYCCQYLSYVKPTQAKQFSNRLASSMAPNSSRISSIASLVECLKAYDNECDDDAGETSEKMETSSLSSLLPSEKNDDSSSVSRSSGDKNEEFSRATRRRGLYLRFGRLSNDEQDFPKQLANSDTDGHSYRIEDETNN